MKANIVRLNDLTDPRLVPYVGLRGANANSFRHADSQSFVGEGRLVVSRMLESQYEVASILVQEERCDQYAEQVPAGTPILTLPRDRICELVGFDFHRGVMACGIRKPMLSASELIPQSTSHPELLLGLIGLSDSENLGVILRSAAALGVRKILLGQKTVDPFCRRTIRVSMSSVFAHQFYVLDEVAPELKQLSAAGIQIIATTLNAMAEPLDKFRNQPCPDRRLLLIGNEANGLDNHVQSMADARVRIPMHNQIDSLNAAVATAILLYELQLSTAPPASPSSCDFRE